MQQERKQISRGHCYIKSELPFIFKDIRHALITLGNSFCPLTSMNLKRHNGFFPFINRRKIALTSELPFHGPLYRHITHYTLCPKRQAINAKLIASLSERRQLSISPNNIKAIINFWTRNCCTTTDHKVLAKSIGLDRLHKAL